MPFATFGRRKYTTHLFCGVKLILKILEISQIKKIYAIKTSEILQFVPFNLLGQFEDIRRDIKEGNESIKGDTENISCDIKSMMVVTESIKEDVKDIKMDVKEFVKAMKVMKNIEKPEVKEEYTRKLMENVESNDFTNIRLILGKLYLVGFIFVLKDETFSVI